jgi:hypothetical protein
MIDAIWFYEQDFENGKPYPLTPAESHEVDISKLDFHDHKQINKIVKNLEQMGADFIAVLPDYRHRQGFDYPHIAVSFPYEEQAKKCARKYKCTTIMLGREEDSVLGF